MAITPTFITKIIFIATTTFQHKQIVLLFFEQTAKLTSCTFRRSDIPIIMLYLAAFYASPKHHGPVTRHGFSTAMNLLNRTQKQDFPSKVRQCHRKHILSIYNDVRHIKLPNSSADFTEFHTHQLSFTYACRSLNVYVSGRYSLIPYIRISVRYKHKNSSSRKLFIYEHLSPLP